MPRIALNMTTLVQGGVLQRAVSFVQHLQEDSGGYDWRLFVSPRVEKELAAAEVTVQQPFSVLGPSPARNRHQRTAIAAAIEASAPDLVFTFAGPSYLRLSCRQLMGVADGWVTHATPIAFESIPSWRERWVRWGASKYKLRWFRGCGHFVVQTETARRGLANQLRIDPEQIFVVSNTCAPWYRDYSYSGAASERKQPTQILYFAAQYPHKRHDMIPEVCEELQKLDERDFQFVVTLPERHALTELLFQSARRLGVAEHLKNIGPIPVTAGPGVYDQSDICFVPSVLETFSATYVESMAAGVPIVASDFGFAREICGQAALYFDVSRPREAAEQLAKIMNDSATAEQLRTVGRKQLEQFPTPQQQQQQYYQIIQRVLDGR